MWLHHETLLEFSCLYSRVCPPDLFFCPSRHRWACGCGTFQPVDEVSEPQQELDWGCSLAAPFLQKRPERFCHLFVLRPRSGEKFAQHRQRSLEQLSARRTQHDSSVKCFLAHTCTHTHTQEAPVSVFACSKDSINPLSSWPKGFCSPNRVLPSFTLQSWTRTLDLHVKFRKMNNVWSINTLTNLPCQTILMLHIFYT